MYIYIFDIKFMKKQYNLVFLKYLKYIYVLVYEIFYYEKVKIKIIFSFFD